MSGMLADVRISEHPNQENARSIFRAPKFSEFCGVAYGDFHTFV